MLNGLGWVAVQELNLSSLFSLCIYIDIPKMVSEFKFFNSSPVGIADVDLNRHPDSSIGSRPMSR